MFGVPICLPYVSFVFKVVFRVAHKSNSRVGQLLDRKWLYRSDRTSRVNLRFRLRFCLFFFRRRYISRHFLLGYARLSRVPSVYIWIRFVVRIDSEYLPELTGGGITFVTSLLSLFLRFLFPIVMADICLGIQFLQSLRRTFCPVSALRTDRRGVTAVAGATTTTTRSSWGFPAFPISWGGVLIMPRFALFTVKASVLLPIHADLSPTSLSSRSDRSTWFAFTFAFPLAGKARGSAACAIQLV